MNKEEVVIFPSVYWSKSFAFLLPLTGMKKAEDFVVESYLRWGEDSIEDYKLVVKVNHGGQWDVYEKFMKDKVTKKKNAFIRESYNFPDYSILIFDLSEWSDDVQMFLLGRYSRLSEEAKDIITEYHTFYDDGNALIEILYHGCLEPNEGQRCLGIKEVNVSKTKETILDPVTNVWVEREKIYESPVYYTPIEFIEEHYKCDLSDIGEIGSKPDLAQETLKIRQVVTDNVLE